MLLHLMHIYFLVTTNTSPTFSLSHNKVLLKKLRLYLSLSMSISYLLLLFLCISLHACNARHLRILDKKLEKKPQFYVKSDEKNGYDSSPKQLNEGDDKMKTRLVADSEKPKNQRSTNQRVLKAMQKASGALKTGSLVSVSWRVPRKKRSQKHPGFNLDYSPPKTHPPSHN